MTVGDVSRREMILAIVGSGLSRTLSPPEGGRHVPDPALVGSGFSRTETLDLATLKESPARVVPVDRAADVSRVEIARTWTGPLCRSTLTNRGPRAVKIREVVLFDLDTTLPASTHLYGEGFQMLTQTGGTLGAPVDYSQYTDAKHYKLPEPEGARNFYGLLTLPPGH